MRDEPIIGLPPPAPRASTIADIAEDIARDIKAVAALDAVPILLQIIRKTTGMEFAAVARVTEANWIACAVEDDIGIGLTPGSSLDVKATLCLESRVSATPVIIDQVSTDPRYRNHHAPTLFKFESYISVPIVMPSGRYFGNLCAVGRAPAALSDPKITAMFEGFAQLIAAQLASELARESEHALLQDERATSELREQFIAILGHDLRNPLHAIFAGADLLERRLEESTLKGMASRIKTSARRMSSLIDDVLDFARSRAGGGIGVQIEEIANVDKELKTVVSELQEGRPDRKILANISVTRTVRCDPARLQQVASNLIGNALAHGSPVSPVKVSANTSDDYLTLEVWNAGTPIPADSLQKIFQPYWRQDSSNRQGLGLGLHICSEIVRAHGGQISVTSTEKEGTAFTARFPLHH